MGVMEAKRHQVFKEGVVNSVECSAESHEISSGDCPMDVMTRMPMVSLRYQ
jgi:hypothetical protein